jgi:hypothetical protein
LTETPGVTVPMQANILPPTFQASCPPPQGSETSAPGKVAQIALTRSRVIGAGCHAPTVAESLGAESLGRARVPRYQGAMTSNGTICIMCITG